MNSSAKDRLERWLDLSISCRRLKSRFNACNLGFIVVAKSKDGNTWFELARTDWKTDRNPDFANPISLQFLFGERQDLMFEVWEVMNESSDLEHSYFFGEAQINLGSIVASRDHTVTLPLLEKDRHDTAATITLQVREMPAPRSYSRVCIVVAGTGLDKKDLLSSDPFLEFFRAQPDYSAEPWRLVHTTEVHGSTLEPKFAPIFLDLELLCGNVLEQPILIKCWDHDDFSSNDFIGECQITVAELTTGVVRKDLINPKKAKKLGNKYVNSGVLVFQQAALLPHPLPFLNWLASGWKLSLMAAVSLHGWTGSPSPAYSPHEYRKALSSVGSILAPYAPQQQFRIYGFGASVEEGKNENNNCFPLIPNQPLVDGVDGLLDAYEAALTRARYRGGRTSLTEMLNMVEDFARVGRVEETYYVLLLICNETFDYRTTVRCLVRLSRLPVSIILVGLGSGKMEFFHQVDSDHAALQSDGTYAKRDLIQFVPFREFSSEADLARATLAELPVQFCWYQAQQGNVPPSWKTGAEGEEEKKDP